MTTPSPTTNTTTTTTTTTTTIDWKNFATSQDVAQVPTSNDVRLISIADQQHVVPTTTNPQIETHQSTTLITGKHIYV